VGRRGAVGLAWGLLVVAAAVGRFAVGFFAAAGVLAARSSSRDDSGFANWAGLKSVAVVAVLVAARSETGGEWSSADARLLPRCCCAGWSRLSWSSPWACASDSHRLRGYCLVACLTADTTFGTTCESMLLPASDRQLAWVPSAREGHRTCSLAVCLSACKENAIKSACCCASHPFGKLSGSCEDAGSLLLSWAGSACGGKPAPPAACTLLPAVKLLSAHVAPSLSDLPSAPADVDHGATESVSPDGLLSGLCCGERCTPRCLGSGARVADAAPHMMRRRAATV